ncbi:MAG TPA: 4Fe-4S dicluster domain-containing protein [Thermodesulfovibrionales bacterium]|nr:4Fe-4S dicluster domain-containing protein [Thermodesulfovibrionales bacterium]
MTIGIKGIQRWRRLTEVLQGAVILGIPFLKIGGESALRFDIPSLKLHFFGVTLWMEEFFIVLVAVIFVTFLIVLITVVFGRIWCGWLCPQTVIVDFTRFVDRASSKGFGYKLASLAATLAVSVIVAASLIWYFVSPYEFFGRLLSEDMGKIIWGFWIVLTGILFLNFVFLRHRFCATVCPYAKLQSVLYDNGTLVIAFDPERREECMDCMACVRVCPVGIDIRKGMSGACINCAECIDKCTEMRAKVKKESLINYSFGLPGEKRKIIRQNVVMISLITLASFAFLLHLFFSRVAIDMTVLPNQGFLPRTSADGTALNSYLLSFRNRSRADLTVKIRAKGERGEVSIIPDTILLKAGEYRKIPVFVRMEGEALKGGSGGVDISVESRQDERVDTITKKVYFEVPHS